MKVSVEMVYLPGDAASCVAGVHHADRGSVQSRRSSCA